MGWSVLCREDRLANECGVTAAEANPIAQAARVRKTEKSNISWNESGFVQMKEGASWEDVEVGEKRRLEVDVANSPEDVAWLSLLAIAHALRLQPCPEVSRSCEWSSTAQEVRVIPPSFRRATSHIASSCCVWIRAYEKCVPVVLRTLVLSHHIFALSSVQLLYRHQSRHTMLLHRI